MAGGGILPTEREYRIIRQLKPHHMCVWLTTLDEDGWVAAQSLLYSWERTDYQKQQNHGEEWR